MTTQTGLAEALRRPKTATCVSMDLSMKIVCFAKALSTLAIVWKCILGLLMNTVMNVLIAMNATELCIHRTAPIAVNAIFALRVLDVRTVLVASISLVNNTVSLMKNSKNQSMRNVSKNSELPTKISPLLQLKYTNFTRPTQFAVITISNVKMLFEITSLTAKMLSDLRYLIVKM